MKLAALLVSSSVQAIGQQAAAWDFPELYLRLHGMHASRMTTCKRNRPTWPTLAVYEYSMP